MKRRVPLRRRAVRPDVVALQRRIRRMVRDRAGDLCEICGRARYNNIQHRLPLSAGGTWDIPNLLAVCGNGNVDGCHGLIHQHSTTAYANGWSVRRGTDPAAMPVLLMTERGKRYVWLRADGSIEYVDFEQTDLPALIAQDLY